MTPGPGDATSLREGAAELGARLDQPAIDRLLDYLVLLYRWDRRVRLTTIEPADAVRLHLLDSLSLLPYLGPGRDLVDLGTGAGLPGIPLAIADPLREVVLVESKRKRCSFLLEAIRTLGLTNCTVVEEDARVLAASGRTYGCVVARAFLPPPALVALAARMVEPGGRLLMMGGRERLDAAALAEAAGAGFRTVVNEVLELPGGGECRRVIALGRGG
ncbi:MAG: 16S rRNA (guanine(527)-N(7))-methyltransferase RsmG [Candidatus Binatia bacterium]